MAAPVLSRFVVPVTPRDSTLIDSLSNLCHHVSSPCVKRTLQEPTYSLESGINDVSARPISHDHSRIKPSRRFWKGIKATGHDGLVELISLLLKETKASFGEIRYLARVQGPCQSSSERRILG